MKFFNFWQKFLPNHLSRFLAIFRQFLRFLVENSAPCRNFWPKIFFWQKVKILVSNIFRSQGITINSQISEEVQIWANFTKKNAHKAKFSKIRPWPKNLRITPKLSKQQNWVYESILKPVRVFFDRYFRFYGPSILKNRQIFVFFELLLGQKFLHRARLRGS